MKQIDLNGKGEIFLDGTFVSCIDCCETISMVSFLENLASAYLKRESLDNAIKNMERILLNEII